MRLIVLNNCVLRFEGTGRPEVTALKFNQKTLKGLLTAFSILLVLLLILLRGGREPAPGVLVAEDTAYRLYADGKLFTLRLLDAAGRTVREEGPMAKEPQVREEEPGLWSVTHSAGPDITLQWTYFYDFSSGQISEAFYGVFDEQDRMLVRAEQTGLQVRGLFFPEPDLLLTDFSQPLAETAATPFRNAAFVEEGRALKVTYLSGEDFHEVTEILPLPRPES